MNATHFSTDQDGADRTQNTAFGFVIAFLVSLFLILALPLFSGAESALSQAGGEEIGPFLVLVVLIFGFALAGRQSPLAAGVAAGIIALISIALALTTAVVVLLASLLDEFVEYDFGGGMWAVVAASVLGFIAVIQSAQNWRGLSPPTWTPIAVVGAIASIAMIAGLVIPEEGFTLSDTLGFAAHPLVGVTFTAFLVCLGLVGVAGFALGRWGVGLLAGFIGYILIGWVTSTNQDQSTAFGWSGVTTGVDFHPVTVIGFWTATAMFAVHAVQQLSGQLAAAPMESSSGTGSARPSPVPATWAPDPYGHGVHRYWNGRNWTTKISDTSGNVLEAATELRPPADSAANWYTDPLQHAEHRYFDGTDWTERVANAGVASRDAPLARPPVVPAEAPATPPASPQPSTPTPPIPATSSLPVGEPASQARRIRQPAPPAGSPTIRFADGQQRQLTGTLIIGRSPAPVDEFADAELIRVSDITVSKTHVVVGQRGSRIWVRDLHSSNGVTLDDGAGERAVEPGQDVVVAPGVRVVLGDETHFVIEVEAVDSTIPRSDPEPQR